jgi:hypothetical protein
MPVSRGNSTHPSCQELHSHFFPTTVTEPRLDVAPYFMYSSNRNGVALWAEMTFEGEQLDRKRRTTTKYACNQASIALSQLQYRLKNQRKQISYPFSPTNSALLTYFCRHRMFLATEMVNGGV